jgi:hypothetical protein
MAARQIKRAVQADTQFLPAGGAERSAENFFPAGRGAAKVTSHIFNTNTKSRRAQRFNREGVFEIIFTAKSKSLIYNSEFGRIFGAKRQKPGFPLQVLGFAYANPVGFPLQSLARASAADSEIAVRQFRVCYRVRFFAPAKNRIAHNPGCRLVIRTENNCLWQLFSVTWFQSRKRGRLLLTWHSLETTPGGKT